MLHLRKEGMTIPYEDLHSLRSGLLFRVPEDGKYVLCVAGEEPVMLITIKNKKATLEFC